MTIWSRTTGEAFNAQFGFLQMRYDSGRIISFRCICKLSRLKIENKSVKKWQNAAKWISFIFDEIYRARPWMSATFEFTLRSSICISTVEYWPGSDTEIDLGAPTNTLRARLTCGSQRVPLTCVGFSMSTCSSLAMDFNARTLLGLKWYVFQIRWSTL